MNDTLFGEVGGRYLDGCAGLSWLNDGVLIMIFHYPANPKGSIESGNFLLARAKGDWA